jgi:sialate O-acetylesterase
MVLQRDKEVCVYGTDTKAETVIVIFMGKEYSSIVDESGDFSVILPSNQAGGPYDITVIGSETRIISDILFGDVYLLAGQSNMELPLRRVMDVSAEEISQTNEPDIRQYVLPATYQFAGPSRYMSVSTWKKAKKEDIMGFSAAGYFFAKELKDVYKVPVGLILAAVGGSTIEAWMSQTSVQKFGEYNPIVKEFYNLDYFNKYMNNQQELANRWLEELEKNELKVTGEENFRSWNVCTVPSLVSDYGDISFQGSVYLCREIFLEDEPTEYISIYMGSIIDSDCIWINNELIGQTGYRYPPRKYPIPAGVLRKGSNIILIRLVINKGNGGTIKDKPYFLSYNNKKVSMAGEWYYRIGKRAETPMPDILFPTRLPTGLYHTAIVPLSKIALKGMLWYQGESNTFDPSGYGDKFAEMLCNLRRLFDYELPCIYVQLPGYQEPLDNRTDSGWAELRHQQWLNRSLNQVAMVITLDLGEFNDLHPQNKKTVGVRLAKAARYLIYHDKVDYSGPICEKGMVKGNQVILEFSNLESQVEVQLNNFEIAESNQIFYKATAVRYGKTVILTSDKVARPAFIRFAWCDNPKDINFYNTAGIPAAGFRMELETLDSNYNN